MSVPISGSQSLRVLVVDPTDATRHSLLSCLTSDGHHAVACASVEEALAALTRRMIDVAFLDTELRSRSGAAFPAALLAHNPGASVVLIVSESAPPAATPAQDPLAVDSLHHPFTPAQVRALIARVARDRRLEWRIQSLEMTSARDPEADFPSEDAATRSALGLARQVADSQANVLIEGELGTGKGRLARAIHAWSDRAGGPVAVVACDSPAEALEAELFGVAAPDEGSLGTEPFYAPGKVSFCEGGTLVLEEIGLAPPSMGTKLLTLLRDKEYERQNDFHIRKADVRLVATTSFPLAQAVDRKRMRPELLAALEVVKVQVPPLRQRPADIPALARRYLAHFARENHRPIHALSTDALHALKRHTWPGNARELRNVIERAVLLCQEQTVSLQHLPSNLLGSSGGLAIGDLVPLQTIEALHVRGVVSAAGSIRGAAAVLGIHENTLARWLRQYPVG